jgi:site-specific DNA-methyltransferase (adenine-specific)
MVFTDPPYGHNNNNSDDLIARWEAAMGRLPSSQDCPPARPIANDGAEANELVQWFYSEASRLLKGAGCCCCCGGGGPDPQFARWSLWLDQHLSFKQMVVWDKGPMGMGWHYRRSYETVLVANKGQKSHWFDESDRIENIIRPGQYGIRKIIPQAHEHPTEKPVELPSLFIALHTQPGWLVCDPFMGSGSTAEAAKRSGRRFLGVELEERWCERSANRLRQEVFQFD